MYLIAVFALLLFVVFLIFIGRQSSSVQRNKKSREGIWPDSGSDLSMLPITPPQDIRPDTSVSYSPGNNLDSVVSVSSVDYGGGVDSSGALGSALADEGASRFGALDSGSNFGSSTDFGGSGDFGGGSATDGSSGS